MLFPIMYVRLLIYQIQVGMNAKFVFAQTQFF